MEPNVVKIPLTRGMFAVIDEIDYELISKYTWHPSRAAKGKHFYASAHNPHTYPEKRTEVRMHRLIMGVTDRWVLVDHIDHNTLNNTRLNLRICTNSENLQNSRKRSGGTSKYKGVSRCVTKNGFLYFQAKINIPGHKTKHLGSFQNEAEAAQAYNETALRYYGEFAHINII